MMRGALAVWDVESLEAHWLGCMASAGGGGKLTRLAGAVVLNNPTTPVTMLNCILLRKVTPERLEGLLEVGGVVLAAHERPPALFLTPLAGELPELEEGLTRLGWHCVLRQAVLVRALDESLAALSGAGWEEGDRALPQVVESDDREAWGRLLAEAYEVPELLSAGIRSAWTGLTGEAHYYWAFLDGRPVGTGLTWRQGNTVGLYAGAVLPPFRRRGVERATLLKRMEDAALRGAGLAMLQTETGSPVDHLCRNRLGFTPAYERSLWMPPRPLGERSPRPVRPDPPG